MNACALVACSASRDDSRKIAHLEPTAQPFVTARSHRAGSPGFALLPPLAPASAEPGDFVPGLPVTVRIDQLTATGHVVRTLATFTATSGPAGEHLRVHYQGRPSQGDDRDSDPDPQPYYYARWLTNKASSTPSASYRVRVLVPDKGDQPRELGHADVYLAATERELRTVDTQSFTPLLSGNTLRIKFRVGWPAVDVDHDGVYDWIDNCPTVANPDQTDSLQNGTGDACRCLTVKCARTDECHVKGVCQPATGTCTDPPVNDGMPCTIQRARAACTSGQCQLIACSPGYADCDDDVADGCEASVTSPTNCGACGSSCSEGPHSQAVCRNRTCELRCDKGYADCDGDAATGCERYVLTDANNCGSCGKTCERQEGCISGACTTATCQAGYADCDRSTKTGCEVNLTSDPHNCGACGHVCDTANGTAGCADGECTIASCAAGYADCNHVVGDGCEIDLTTDLANCGGCALGCAPPNGTGACAGGSCAISRCNAGFADCDGNLSNGCEISLAADTGNCGSCGHMCVLPNATPVCTSGTCAVGTCNTGHADCNGLPADGCEATTLTELNNCGACGNACSTSLPNEEPTCAGGLCSSVCVAGFSDCDSDPSNGCETNVQGQCGVCACSFPHAVGECTGGACTFSVCEPGFADCDGNQANGCEVELSKNCGACGAACDDGDQCTDDSCNPTLGCVHTPTTNVSWLFLCFLPKSSQCIVTKCQGTISSHTCVDQNVPDGIACRPLSGTNPNNCFNPGVCAAGVCQGSTPVACPAVNPCFSSQCIADQCRTLPSFSGTCTIPCPTSDPVPECHVSVYDGKDPFDMGCVLTTTSFGRCGMQPCYSGGSCMDGFCHGNFREYCGTRPGGCLSTEATCDGFCFRNLPLPDGTSCSDSNVCNGAEACQQGVCTAGSPPPDGTACGDAGQTCSSLVCQ